MSHYSFTFTFPDLSFIVDGLRYSFAFSSDFWKHADLDKFISTGIYIFFALWWRNAYYVANLTKKSRYMTHFEDVGNKPKAFDYVVALFLFGPIVFLWPFYLDYYIVKFIVKMLKRALKRK